jgi:hypothetical protein
MLSFAILKGPLSNLSLENSQVLIDNFDGLTAWRKNPDFNSTNLTDIPILTVIVEPITQF